MLSRFYEFVVIVVLIAGASAVAGGFTWIAIKIWQSVFGLIF